MELSTRLGLSLSSRSSNELWVLLEVRHCRHCLGKGDGGCWFGLFNNDSCRFGLSTYGGVFESWRLIFSVIAHHVISPSVFCVFSLFVFPVFSSVKCVVASHCPPPPPHSGLLIYVRRRALLYRSFDAWIFWIKCFFIRRSCGLLISRSDLSIFCFFDFVTVSNFKYFDILILHLLL